MLLETSCNDVLRSTDLLGRNPLHSRFLEMKNNQLLFVTQSEKSLGDVWYQNIDIDPDALAEFKELAKDDLSLSIGDFLLNVDVKVYCSCPSFLYHYSYIAYQLGYGLLEQEIPPMKQREGFVCKHLVQVFKDLPAVCSHLRLQEAFWSDEYRLFE